MAETMEAELTKVRLDREGAIALVKEARERFDNGVAELYGCGDESQRPTIAACVEIIGRVAPMTSPWRWPTRQTAHGEQEEVWFDEFAFTAETMAWLRWNRDQHAPYVADVDSGVAGLAEPGYHAEQVYLLHVMDGLLKQVQD